MDSDDRWTHIIPRLVGNDTFQNMELKEALVPPVSNAPSHQALGLRPVYLSLCSELEGLLTNIMSEFHKYLFPHIMPLYRVYLVGGLKE